MVSVAQAPIFRWVVAPRPDRAAVDALAERLHLPEALAALLLQRGQGEVGGGPEVPPARARRSVRSPTRSPGWPTRSRRSSRAVRAGGTIMVHGDYDVDGQCGTAVLTRALRAGRGRRGAVRAAPASRRLRLRTRRSRGRSRRRRVAGDHLRLRHHRGGHRARRRARPGSASSSPTTTCPATSCRPAIAIVDPQRPDDTLGARPISAAPASRSSWCRRWSRLWAFRSTSPTTCSIWWRWPRWRTWCRSSGENRILVKHGLRLLAESNWPGVRALVEASGLAGKELRAGHLGFILGPRLNAAGRIGDAADGLRLLLSDDMDEAAALARRLEGLNVERQALDQRILDEALGQVELADLERDSGFVLAGDGWHPGVVGIVASRVVERYGRPDVPDRVRRRHRQGLGPEHLPLRSALGAPRLRRPAGALRRPPDGGRAHHPAGEPRRVPRAVRRHRARARSRRRISDPSSGWTSSSACTR